MINLDKINITAIYFGIFSSNSWSPSIVYKLTENDILIDKSESYWATRFSENGYIFNGESFEISKPKFLVAQNLFNQVPADIFKIKLPRNSDVGNKDEYTIFIQIDFSNNTTIQFKIDEYDVSNLEIEQRIIEFKNKIKETIQIIQN